MRKTRKRHLAVEALESMTLLSGMAGAVAHPAAATLPNPLVLSGSVHGSFKPKGLTSGAINASGNLGFGKITLKGNVVVPTTSGTPETLTVSTTKGSVTVNGHVTPTGAGVFSGTYSISGGTKVFAGESGSGSIVVSVSGTKFTATFSH
jgi:hypothetical protein